MKPEKIFNYLFLLLLPSIVVSFAANSVVLISLSALALYQLKGKYTRSFFNKYLIFSAFLAAILIGLIIDLILLKEFDSRQITKRTAFILMPFIIYYSKQNIQRLSLKVFVYFLSSLSFVLLLTGLIRSVLNRGKIIYGNWDSKTTEAFYEQDMILNWGELSYKRIFFFWDMHPSYYALFSCICILILLFTTYIPIKKSWKLFLLSIHIVMIVLVSSKAGLASLLLIAIIAVFSSNTLRHKLIGVSVILLIIVSSLSIPSTQLRIKSAYESLRSDKIEDIQNSTTNRITLFKALSNFSPKELIFGQGIKASQGKVHMITGINKNLHNQFLQTLIGSGILGLLLLTAFLISPLIQTRSLFINSFVVIIFLNLLLENMLDRVWGIIFISFFYAMFIFGDLRFSVKKSEDMRN